MSDAYAERQRAVRQRGGGAAASTLNRLTSAMDHANAIEAETEAAAAQVQAIAPVQAAETATALDRPGSPQSATSAEPQIGGTADTRIAAASPEGGPMSAVLPEPLGTIPAAAEPPPRPLAGPEPPQTSAAAAAGPRPAVPIPGTRHTAAQRRDVHSQGITFFRDDFETLQDIVHDLHRRRKIRNPLGARLGPSHVVGAMVHHMLATWEADPEAIADIVQRYLAEWAGSDAPKA